MRSLGDLSAVEWSVLTLVSIGLAAAVRALHETWMLPLALLVLVLAVRVYLRRSE